jgi:hypothetical protein
MKMRVDGAELWRQSSELSCDLLVNTTYTCSDLNTVICLRPACYHDACRHGQAAFAARISKL